MLAAAETAVSNHEYRRANDDLAHLLALLDEHPQDTLAYRQLLTDVLVRYGEICAVLGEINEGMALLQRAKETAVTQKQFHRIASTIGNVSIRLGNTEVALAHHQEALRIAELEANKAWIAIAASNISSSYKHNGDTDNAIIFAETAVSLYEQLGDVDGQVNALIRVGLIYEFLGQFDKDISALRKAEQLAREHHIPQNLAVVLNNLGEGYRHLYAVDDAFVCHEEGLAIARSLYTHETEIDLHRNLGVDLIMMGNADDGVTHLWYALLRSRKLGMVDTMQQALFSLALAELNADDQEMARQHIAELTRLADQSDRLTYRADALYALGLYHQKMSDFKRAHKLLKRVCALTYKTGRSERLWQAHAALARLVVDGGRTAVHNRIAAKIIHQIADPIEDERLQQLFLNAEPIRAVLDAIPPAK